MLGIRTCGGWMEGTDESTGLWRHPPTYLNTKIVDLQVLPKSRIREHLVQPSFIVSSVRFAHPWKRVSSEAQFKYANENLIILIIVVVVVVDTVPRCFFFFSFCSFVFFANLILRQLIRRNIPLSLSLSLSLYQIEIIASPKEIMFFFHWTDPSLFFLFLSFKYSLQCSR